MGMKKATLAVLLGLAAGAFVFTSVAQADMKEMKTYKEAFPEAKVKCVDCHKDAMPKKDDGKHELNAYGTAVVAEAKKEVKDAAEVKPTADAYKKVGKIEDFKPAK